MDVEDAIHSRRSVRSYKDKEVPQEKLERILESVRMAPSANNKQEWKFIVVRDPEKKKEVFEATKGQNQVREAPVVIAGVSTDPDYIMTSDIPSGAVDLSIAMDHLSLKATEEGLGTCWIGAFYQEEVKEALEISEGSKVVVMMTLGYPEEPLEKEEKNRMDLEEIISYNTFSE